MKKFPYIKLPSLTKFHMMKRQMIFILVIVLFIASNIAASFVSLRADFSFGKSYTLSSSTKKILSHLDDLVTLKLYVSSDLPAKFTPLKTDVIDLLNEYKRANSSKVQVKVFDTKSDQQAAKEAKDAAIPDMQFSLVEQDNFAVSSSPFGMIIQYAGKQVIIPQVSDVGGLEYNISSSLYKLTEKTPVKVALMTQTDSFTAVEQASSLLQEILRKQFTFVNPDGNASEEAQLNSDVKTLLVLDSRTSPFTDAQIQKIKNYLQNNGTVIFSLDGIWISDDLTNAPAKHGLSDLLKEYGITIQPDLVLSANSQIINFGNGQQSMPFRYPYWIVANTANGKSNYFVNTSQAMFPWTSSLKVEQKTGYTVTELLKTSQLSWEQTDTFTLDPQKITDPKKEDLKQFTIIAQSTKQNGGTVIVIPSSRFILDKYQGNNGDNVAIALNMVNTFASNGLLTGINQRSVNFYPLPDLDTTQKDILKYGAMLALPVLFGLYGAFRLMRRK